MFDGFFRRRFALSLGLAAAAAAAGCNPRPQPDIVLVTIDTLRADRLGAYGYHRDTSPSLDALAKEGYLFENALSVMGTTLPAHVSLMTSAGTLTHGIKGNFNYLGVAYEGTRETSPLAVDLAAAGYETAAFVGATPLKRHAGLALGFDHYDDPSERERSAEETTEAVLAWLGRERTRPFFLWVHYFDPHYKYRAPADYDSLFTTDAAQIEWLEGRGIDHRDPRVVRQNNRYDREVRYVDDQLGRVFRALKQGGLWERAAVLVTADHGEGLGQHDWMHHGYIYNEQLRVPLILKWPAGVGPRAKGQRESRLVSLLDVVPTLVRHLGVPVAPERRARYEGLDLFAAETSRDFLFAERTTQEFDWAEKRWFALTGLRWKYLHRSDEGDALFDLEADPGETTNVIARHPEIARSMRRRIDDTLASARVPEADVPDGLPEELVEELRGLGYVEP